MTPQTLYDKLLESHAVHVEDDGTTVLYIDRHLVHEVTGPQAFEGLKLARRLRKVFGPATFTMQERSGTARWVMSLLRRCKISG